MARPRDPAVDRAVHEATLDLVARHGLSGVTVQAIASRAGVPRSTVYRRHDDVPALVLDAVDTLLALPEPELSDDDREAWADLVESLRRALLESRVGLSVLAALLLADQEHPELLDLWRSRVVDDRVRMIARRFGWSPTFAAQIAQLVLGGLVAAHVAAGPVSPERARGLADLLWDRFVDEGTSGTERTTGSTSR